MKDFTYYNNKRSLLMSDCDWLTKTGLRETLWILDSEWFIAFYKNQITFNKWINK